MYNIKKREGIMYKIDLSYIVSMEEHKKWVKETTTYKTDRSKYKKQKR